ncbi:hypothetical protein AXF42_Ash015360 [Apostasia shenzhenica]|uniref:Transcriptional coactivator Hfi1/Transcriptional adapter 1 n=1 Tax=Apostasia shenzhenica TaxID=1088818 RepID=A0A2I0AM12_9ASPA|nr:hypothetical protein AXF42_Ash015360 [Apostasia shenzhenica]
MPPPTAHQQGRINLFDLKNQIEKRLGPERAQHYFSYLNRFLANKLSKPEFNKLCFVILGREIIPLHNLLIQSILKNAYQAKTPPILAVEYGKKFAHNDALSPLSQAPLQPHSIVPCNGDILPSSPRKSRSGIRDRRLKDRPTPLGPNGKIDFLPHKLSLPTSENARKENGVLGPCDWRRPMQTHQGGSAEQPENTAPAQIKVVAVEDKKKEEKKDHSNTARRPFRAPLGIPFCSVSIGGSQRPLPLPSSGSSNNCNYDTGEICDSETLRKRMEKMAAAHGLGEVKLDCANLLNNGLDAYLKRLIKTSAELAGARSLKQSMKHPAHGKSINGIWPGNHMHVHSGRGFIDDKHDNRKDYAICLQDLKVAMELNPQQLGEDWPLLVEKISNRSLEE